MNMRLLLLVVASEMRIKSMKRNSPAYWKQWVVNHLNCWKTVKPLYYNVALKDLQA